MPCKKHAEELEDHSDFECEACKLEDKAEEAHWRQLYEGEKQAGLLDEPAPWLYPGRFYCYR